MVYNLLISIPSLFVAPLWGPWTDKGSKRKPALLVAIIGAGLEMTTVLLSYCLTGDELVFVLSVCIRGH